MENDKNSQQFSNESFKRSYLAAHLIEYATLHHLRAIDWSPGVRNVM
jgi:hypothetical protein